MTIPRVLIVEDEDNIALALGFLIAREGYAGERLSTGRGAADRIRETRPDLVLLDAMLPGASGYEICETVRRDPGLSGVKILMLSARGAAGRGRSLALGADGFIGKPFEIGDLRREMRRLLDAGT